jgi:phosphate-selective porin
MRLSPLLCGLVVLALAPLAAPAQTPAAPTQAQIDKIQNELDTLKAQVNDPEGGLQTAVADVNKLKKITLSGYAQLRLDDNRGAAVANGAGGAGDARLNFSQRRVRLKVVGRPVDTSAITYSFDLGDKGFVTKDATYDYFFRGDPGFGATASMGQFAVPFGYQNTQSSSAMEAPERAKVVKGLFPDEYDRGVKFTTPTDPRVVGDLAVVQGTGQNVADNNQQKNLVERLRVKVLPRLDAGVSGYQGKNFVAGATAATPTGRSRYGADVQYYLDGTSVKAEYITGYDSGVKRSGYYVLVAHNLTTATNVVAMFDAYRDPAAKNGILLLGNQTAWTVGVNHFIDTATRLRLFYEMNKEQTNAFTNNTLRFEVLSVF